MITLTYSKEQLEELRFELIKANKGGNLHHYRVLWALVLIGEQQHEMKDIATLMGVTVRSLLNWLKSFMVNRMALFSKHWFKGRGRHAKLTNQAQKKLYEMIKEGPEANGFNCGGWNTALINCLIEKKFGVRYNERYLATLLKKLGLSY